MKGNEFDDFQRFKTWKRVFIREGEKKNEKKKKFVIRLIKTQKLQLCSFERRDWKGWEIIDSFCCQPFLLAMLYSAVFCFTGVFCKDMDRGVVSCDSVIKSSIILFSAALKLESGIRFFRRLWVWGFLRIHFKVMVPCFFLKKRKMVVSEKRYSNRMYTEKFHNSSHSIASLNLMDKRSILDTREIWKGWRAGRGYDSIFYRLKRTDSKAWCMF